VNPPFVTEPLDRRHDRTSFRSGSEALDRYFRERVTQDIRRRVAGCFVAADEQGKVTLLPPRAWCSMPCLKPWPKACHVPGRSRPLDRPSRSLLEHQGKGLGSALIADAVVRADQLGIGAFALIVDAKDDRAKGFYEAIGFVALPGEPRRLCIPIDTALRALQSLRRSRD